MYSKKINVVAQCTVALGIVANIVGAFLALNLRLPIYMDSIGTVMVSALLGPAYGMITGVAGSLVSGFTFDIYSLWYSPVQIFTGLMAGIFFRTVWPKGIRLPVGAFCVSLPTSIASAFITSYLFGGMTSSGSSYLVQILSKAGLGLTASCFIVQVLTDYADKLVAILIITAVLAAMSGEMKHKIRGGRYGSDPVQQNNK